MQWAKPHPEFSQLSLMAMEREEDESGQQGGGRGSVLLGLGQVVDKRDKSVWRARPVWVNAQNSRQA